MDLNTSTNGPSITKSYQSVVNAPLPTGPAAASPTYGQWAVFSVSAPLANAFQQDSGKESVLKVQSTGEGELLDLIEDFSDGRIQFAYVKVKDSNTGLPKNALVGWCGEGVPERTKGYFTSHLNTVAKLFTGYHVQITARSDRDLTPEGIMQKVADSSGSKYSTSSNPPPVAAATKPSVASKPAFTPTQSLGSGGAARFAPRRQENVDEDGWGADAPPVTRTQLEKVAPAYQPTKVNLRDLTSQNAASSTSTSSQDTSSRPGVIGGGYQPVGKVDINAIRRQAKESGAMRDDRPEVVKGAYEPVGKVDIAAIRARSHQPGSESAAPPPPTSAATEQSESQPPSVASRSAAFSAGPERLTAMPKPKVANKFGGGSAFTGTRAPLPGGFEAKPVASAAPVGAASRTFADEGGKTPAQLWAEKRARAGSGAGASTTPAAFGHGGESPMAPQTSGGGASGWQSGYAGKKWSSVETNKTGRSIPDEPAPEEEEEEEEAPAAASGGIGSIRDRFSGAPPMGAPSTSFDRAPPPPAPEPETSTKPNRGVPMPGLPTRPAEEKSVLPPPPPQPPRPDDDEEEDDQEPAQSPIKVAMPVSIAQPEIENAQEEQEAPPPPMPVRSMAQSAPEEDDEPERGPDPGRAAAQHEAVATMGHDAVEQAPAATHGGERARAEYEYEAAEDNEVSLREGEMVTDVQRVDPDWWLVKNEAGRTGLVPSNYLSVIENEEGSAAPPPAPMPQAEEPEPEPVVPGAFETSEDKGATAVALYDYEAGEDNELSFPENATITNLTFPDEDWWHGEYNGKSGLFPANYTQLQE